MHQQSVIPHRYRYNHTSVKSCRLHRLSLLVLINQLFCYVCCTLCMHNFGNVVVQHIIFLQCVYLACKPSSYTHMVQRWEMSWLPKIPLFGMNGFVNHLLVRGFVYHRIYGFVYHDSLYMILYTITGLNCRRRQMWGRPPVRLDIYSISLFLEGSTEDTPGFGIGSVWTIQRERLSTMMEKRECVCEARASHSYRQWLHVTGQCHYWRRQVVQEYGDHSRAIRYGYPRPQRMVGLTLDNIHATVGSRTWNPQ